MRVLTTPLRKVEQLAFSADGRQLFAVGVPPDTLGGLPPDRGITVLDLLGDTEPDLLLGDSPVISIRTHPTGRWLYANTRTFDDDMQSFQGSKCVAVDLVAGMVHPLEFRAREFYGSRRSAIAVDPGGTRLLINGIPHGGEISVVRCWRLPPESPPVPAWDLPVGPEWWGVRGLAYNPDGRSFLTIEGRSVRNRDMWIGFFTRNPANGAELGKVFRSPVQNADDLAFAPDGSGFAVVAGMSLFLYDSAEPDRKPLKRTNDNRKHFTGLAYHPSGSHLATAGNDKTIKFWDPQTLAPTKTFTWKAGKMRSLAFSPDGRLAAAGTDDGKIVVWDVDL